MDEAKRKLVQSWLKKALHDLAAAAIRLPILRCAILDVAIYRFPAKFIPISSAAMGPVLEWRMSDRGGTR